MSTGEWSGMGWTVTITDTEMALSQPSGSVTISAAGVGRLEVRRRWFRWSLHHEGQPLADFRGMKKTEAIGLSQALQRLALTPAIADAVGWYTVVAWLLAAARTGQRWISTETVDALVAARPEPGVLDRVRAAGYERLLTAARSPARTGFLAQSPVLLISHPRRMSPFVVEQGKLVERKGKFGRSWAARPTRRAGTHEKRVDQDAGSRELGIDCDATYHRACDQQTR